MGDADIGASVADHVSMREEDCMSHTTQFEAALALALQLAPRDRLHLRFAHF